MSDINELKQLIDGFLAYRNVLVPLQESIKSVSDSYDSIKNSVSDLAKTLSPNGISQLEKLHQSVSSQAKSGRELSEKMDEYSLSAQKYAQAVSDLVAKFSQIEKKLAEINAIEKTAEDLIERLDKIVSEKRASYNVKELQKSLELYNNNVEKISDFINKDVANVLTENGKKIEGIKAKNDALALALEEQGKTISSLAISFRETNELLRKSMENDVINESYLFDAFDKWANDRKVKIKKK